MKMLGRFIVQYQWQMAFTKFYSQGTNQAHVSGSSLKSPTSHQVDVPGLSSAVIHPATQPVGPGVDPCKKGSYKVPEYFCYDKTSYFEAEIEMAKYRLPQPSSLKK